MDIEDDHSNAGCLLALVSVFLTVIIFWSLVEIVRAIA